MNRTIMDARKQFSKKLAGRAEWFWFFYMTLMAGLVAYQPEGWIAAIVLASLVTAVMITSVLAYTDNSKYEKGLYAPNQVVKNVKVNIGEAIEKEVEKEAEKEGETDDKNVTEGDDNG